MVACPSQTLISDSAREADERFAASFAEARGTISGRNTAVFQQNPQRVQWVERRYAELLECP